MCWFYSDRYYRRYHDKERSDSPADQVVTSAPTFKVSDDNKKPINVKTTVKPLTAAPTTRGAKKIDMGAALNYGKPSELGINSPTHRNTHNEDLFGSEPVVPKASSSRTKNDIIEDIFSSAAISDPNDDFDPRSTETPADFGDFASAFGNEAPPPNHSVTAPVTTEFADFSSAFSSQPVASVNFSSQPVTVAAPAPVDNFLFAAQPAPASTQSTNDSLLSSADLFGNSVITNAFTYPSMGNKDLLSDFGDLTLNPIQGENPQKVLFSSSIQVIESHDTVGYKLHNENSLNFKKSRPGLSASVSVAPRLEQINAKCDQLVQCLEKVKDIESSEQLEVLLIDLRGLVDLLPCGSRELLDLMANHCSKVEDFANESYGELLTEIVTKTGKSHQSNDEIPTEIKRLVEITDNAAFILETMNTLSDLKLMEISPHLIVQLLVKLLQDDSYLIFSFIRLSKSELDDRVAMKLDQYLQSLLSLPDKVANRFKTDFPRAFELRAFCAILMVNAVKAFYVACHINRIEQSRVFNMTFLSKLISKVFSLFKGEKNVLRTSVQIMLALAGNEMCRESVRELMSGVQRSGIETIVKFSFGEEISKHTLLWTFGDVWKSSSDWKFALTKKIPLLRFSENDQIVENLSFFLASEDIEVMKRVLMELLVIWSTKSHVNDTPFEQHLYITKFIVLMTQYLQDPRENSEKMKQLLFNGMQVHLASSDKKLQVLGMITAEVILGIIDKEVPDEEKLKFEYSDVDQTIVNEVVEVIRSFPDKVESSESLRVFEESDESEITILMEKLLSIVDSNDSVESSAVGKFKRLEQETLEESITDQQPTSSTAPNPPKTELDSDDDDDLQAYDDPDDLPSRREDKRPRYLLDLIQAFTSKENLEDPDRFELSVTAAEEIIKQQLPTHHADLGIDLLRIFISLDKACYMENFNELKMKTLIQICLIYPKESSIYLCEEFNSESSKYAITRRMLMLDILSETAKKLSKLEMKQDDLELSSTPIASTRNKLLIKLNEELENRNKKDAQKIIRRRLIAKTRRITSRTKSLDENSGINRFSEVAGWFFFPLVHGFGRKQMIFKSGAQLKDEMDNLLLVKFLNTIAVMLLCAENSLVAPKMAKEIVNLSVFLRYHEEAQIRLAVLHMVATIILAVPRKVLINEFPREINEFVSHLGMIVKSSVINYEPDQECREFAKQLMGMFHETLYSDE